MDKTCGICRGPHFTADCPNQQHISHGDTRVETDPSILRRQVADAPPPRRPSPFEPRPTPKLVTPPSNKTSPKPVTPLPATVTSVTDCVDCLRYRNKIAALETELRIALAAPRKPTKALTPAEKQRRYRERKAAKAHQSPKPPPTR